MPNQAMNQSVPLTPSKAISNLQELLDACIRRGGVLNNSKESGAMQMSIDLFSKLVGEYEKLRTDYYYKLQEKEQIKKEEEPV